MSKKVKKADLLVIGWREYVQLPDWGISGIKAKSDTGARSSVIDVASVEELPDGLARFEVVLSRTDRSQSVTITAPIVRRTRVKSSFGHAHDRLLVEARISIGSIEKKIELGLVCRKNMLCRMLLGRSALKGTFLVDPAHCYLFGRKKKSSRLKHISLEEN